MSKIDTLFLTKTAIKSYSSRPNKPTKPVRERTPPPPRETREYYYRCYYSSAISVIQRYCTKPNGLNTSPSTCLTVPFLPFSILFRNFTWFGNYEYGNCYVFGAGNMTQNISAPGNQNGLSLLLNIEADEYLGDFSESYGAVVEVANGKEVFFPEENGYLVAPGQITNIGFSARMVKRLDFPYEGTYCGYTGDKRQVPYSYSQMACFKSCYAENQKKECGCADIQYPVTPHCNPLNSTQDRCLREVNVKIRLSNIKCLCNEDCKLIEFLVSTSSALWPTDGYLTRLRSILGNKASNVTSTLSEARRNLARVHIFYKSMTVEVIAQRPRYQFKDLISNVGGSLGLFTGISLLTLVEFVKLMFDLTRFSCKKKTSVASPMHDTNEKELENPCS